MGKQIITIGREFGSGGRLIGEKLASKLDLPYYDKNILDKAAEEKGYSVKLMEEDEKKAKHGFLYSLSSAFGTAGYGPDTLSLNEKFFMAQFEEITKVADQGEGGVIIGRCADYVLRDYDNVIKVFIYADTESKLKRIINNYGISESEAKKTLSEVDKARANYYKYHTGNKWGAALNYDICINSGQINVDYITDLILNYVKMVEGNYRSK